MTRWSGSAVVESDRWPWRASSPCQRGGGRDNITCIVADPVDAPAADGCSRRRCGSGSASLRVAAFPAAAPDGERQRVRCRASLAVWHRDRGASRSAPAPDGRAGPAVGIAVAASCRRHVLTGARPVSAGAPDPGTLTVGLPAVRAVSEVHGADDRRRAAAAFLAPRSARRLWTARATVRRMVGARSADRGPG
jgi:hypothetical protein